MNNEKVQKAIDRLKAFEPANEPYYLCYSGGKDSDCIRILAELAGVKHDIVHNLTTVDAPETVRYIKSIPNVQFELPKYSMWQLIEKKKTPPTRLSRYCCDELKEKGGKGRVKVTGVRWAGSNNRNNNQSLVTIIGKPKATIALAEELQADYEQTPKGGLILNTDNDESRRMVEQCYRTTSTLVKICNIFNDGATIKSIPVILNVSTNTEGGRMLCMEYAKKNDTLFEILIGSKIRTFYLGEVGLEVLVLIEIIDTDKGEQEDE